MHQQNATPDFADYKANPPGGKLEDLMNAIPDIKRIHPAA